jgi:hypothetical protein
MNLTQYIIYMYIELIIRSSDTDHESVDYFE